MKCQWNKFMPLALLGCIPGLGLGLGQGLGQGQDRYCYSTSTE